MSESEGTPRLLELIGLNRLMALTAGRPEIAVGLLDGPVTISHPDLAAENFRDVAGSGLSCVRASSNACTHGTLVAGVLAAKRGTAAPAICPGCTFLVRPIFQEPSAGNGADPKATPEELAAAIVDTVDAGARVVNMSVGLLNPSLKGVADLHRALDYAARRGALCTVAAGNQGNVGGSALTRHSWVIAVGACDLRGNPTADSNLSGNIGRQGLRAPGVGVVSISPDGRSQSFGGTSAATPFVTGTIALIWSLFPRAGAGELKRALINSGSVRRNSVVPPLLDAWGAYQSLAAIHERKAAS